MLKPGSMFAILTATGLAACSGGGSSNGDSSIVTLTPTGPTLRDAPADGTPVLSPIGSSLSGNDATFSLRTDGTISVVFDGATDLDFAPGDASFTADSGVTVFVNNGGADGALLNQPATSGLDYTSFGVWISGASADLSSAAGPFAVGDTGAGYFGVVTSSLPTTGSAQYVGGAVATLTQGSDVQDLLNGTLDARADFASAQLDVSIELRTSNGGDFGTLAATGVNIGSASDGFSSGADGAIIGSDYTGLLSGHFFGPEAEEIGGQFDLNNGTNRVIGAFGGGN